MYDYKIIGKHSLNLMYNRPCRSAIKSAMSIDKDWTIYDIDFVLNFVIKIVRHSAYRNKKIPLFFLND